MSNHKHKYKYKLQPQRHSTILYYLNEHDMRWEFTVLYQYLQIGLVTLIFKAH